MTRQLAPNALISVHANELPPDPRALAVENAVVAFPDALTRRFPDDQVAIEMGLESYLAVCLRAADGTHLGHMAVLDARPMEADDDESLYHAVYADDHACLRLLGACGA